MSNLQKISQSLKPFKEPKHHALWPSISDRLLAQQDELMNWKAQYAELKDVHKKVIFHSVSYDIPNWILTLLPSLQKYLDVQMYSVDFIIGGNIEPSKTIMVVGPEKQTALAKCYINYIVTSVEAFTSVYHKHLLSKAKKIRQEIRDGIKEESERIQDSRSLSSDYRDGIIGNIKSTLEWLLGNQRQEYKMSEFKARLRQQQLNEFVKRHPLKQWHHA